MRSAALALCGALSLWVGAAQAQQDVPEGWPWLLGEVSGTLGKKAIAWQTYDFSIGALDASVWAGEREGQIVFHLRALPPGKPQSDRMVLFVTADIGRDLRAGAASGDVTVEIPRGKDREGPRLSSEGQTATLMNDQLRRDPENINNGRVSGTVTARLCPVQWMTKSCQDFSAKFDTGMQFDGTFEIIESEK